MTEYFRITHVLSGDYEEYGLMKGYALLSLEPDYPEKINPSSVHQLKIRRCFYRALVEDRKKAELRKNDRDYQVGDFISFDVIDD